MFMKHWEDLVEKQRLFPRGGSSETRSSCCNNRRGQDPEPRWAALPGLEGGARTGQVASVL